MNRFSFKEAFLFSFGSPLIVSNSIIQGLTQCSSAHVRGSCPLRL